MLLLLPSNEDHLSGKRILFLQIYRLFLSLNLPQRFRIFVYKHRICLLGCLVLFAHQEFRLTCMSIDFQNDGEKMRKKVLEIEKI